MRSISYGAFGVLLLGQPPPTLLSYVPGTTQVGAVDKALKERDRVMVELQDQLK